MHAFILERSRHGPKLNLFFFLMIYCEVMLLFRCAERRNEFETFLAAIHLVLPFASTQHATKYLRICCDWLKYIKICSPAEEAIIKARCFTLLSEHGAHIAIDYVHEKYVNLIRDTTGKNYKVGHEAKIEYATKVSMDNFNRGSTKKTMEKLRHGGLYLSIDPTSVETFDVRTYSLVMQVLEDNDIFADETEVSKLILPLTGKELDGKVLRIPTIGNGVVSEYTTFYHMENQNLVSRSEKDVKIPPITASGAKIVEAANKRIKLATSTLVDEIKESGTMDEIFKEFEKISPYLLRSQQACIPKISKAVCKKVMCQLLSNLRESAFLRRPGLKAELERKVKEDLELSGTTVESRTRQLEDPLCSMQGCEARNHGTFQLRRMFPEEM